jgi:hypothetical protein
MNDHVLSSSEEIVAKVEKCWKRGNFRKVEKKSLEPSWSRKDEKGEKSILLEKRILLAVQITIELVVFLESRTEWAAFAVQWGRRIFRLKDLSLGPTSPGIFKTSS